MQWRANSDVHDAALSRGQETGALLLFSRIHVLSEQEARPYMLQDREVRTTDSLMDRFFKRDDLTSKNFIRRRRERLDAGRAAPQRRKANQTSPDVVALVDETGTSTNMVRTISEHSNRRMKAVRCSHTASRETGIHFAIRF
jgi:hypothetical protein